MSSVAMKAAIFSLVVVVPIRFLATVNVISSMGVVKLMCCLGALTMIVLTVIVVPIASSGKMTTIDSEGKEEKMSLMVEMATIPSMVATTMIASSRAAAMTKFWGQQ